MAARQLRCGEHQRGEANRLRSELDFGGNGAPREEERDRDRAGERDEREPRDVPGDIGLACPHGDPENPSGFRLFTNGVWYLSGRSDRPPKGDLALGVPGDVPFCADFDGDGMADNGVFRDGRWYTFGGFPRGIPLLLPRWSTDAKITQSYSLAIFRDGAWYMKPDPDGATTLSFSFGQPGDLPGFVYQRRRDELTGSK